MFDRHADWGVLCCLPGLISFVGGEPTFIDAYLHHAGGEDFLRRRLHQFDLGQRWGDEMAPWPPAFREVVYRTCGWVPAPYPNQGEYFKRRPDEDEMRQRWIPLLDRLVPDRTHPLAGVVPNWTTLPLRGHLATDGAKDEVIRDGAPPVLEEYNSWLFILTGDDRWDVGMAALDGDDFWCAPARAAALEIEELAGRPMAAFGPEGDWLLVSFAEGVSLLAGEPTLMARIIDDAGGLDACRERFEAWARTAAVPSERLDEVRALAG
ncbi:hypothetical protein [Magnetospirillum sp. LM-5]|uniref:hypothetical protein n=1 Tax=Magnetospirillum sp. LM-5 TaxID=2681466 RepID=UPI00156E88DB|nr:hypothetical protein [Magnetospirillum sp. LM-5]